MDKYLCIHGHFYQPPRENPWLEEVELQDAAYPYPDWNERITSECYAPNAVSRILERENNIIDIVNNYSNMSFNFGPTLLSWMERHQPKTYKIIIEADKQSREKFSGHGSALAQVYNHLIMPLANLQDKRTQILWGIKDFFYRFGRKPEGMWLSETAVDYETLDLLTEYGITFTVLSPYQAQRIRKVEEKKWADVIGGNIDPKRPYLCRLPSGRVINIFFYDGPVSQDVAFGGLLRNGENFAKRLIGTFDAKRTEPQLVHIATDGETYGHHHHYGEMALSYAFNYIASNDLAKITIYGEYLEKFPPQYEVQIIENSSWSCFHSVERWRSNCGCKIGTHSSWNQQWRAPLRNAMDWLRDKMVKIYEDQMSMYVNDPWHVRNEYISVILDRVPAQVSEFLNANKSKELSEADTIKVLRLLESQRYAMLMYTSCGWFFDDISGIEAMQVIHYASRAMQLIKQATGFDLEDDYLEIIEEAKSNISEYENGAKLYEMFVRPAKLDMQRAGAHYALWSLFANYEEVSDIYCYEAKRIAFERLEAGRQKLCMGSVKIKSQITYEKGAKSFAILHLGDHNVFGGVCDLLDDETFLIMQQEMREAFEKSDVAQIISLLDKYFNSHEYSFWHLFKDMQRQALTNILGSTLREIETSFRQINEHHYPIMLAMKEISIPLPGIFSSTLEFIVNADLLKELKAEEVDFKKLRDLIVEIKRWPLKIDKTTLGFIAGQKINELMERISSNPGDIPLMKTVEGIFKILQPLELPLRLWEAQNSFFFMGKRMHDKMEGKANHGDKTAKRWMDAFSALGKYLSVKSI
ncbi:MAG: DUF3536 domain-containing protein [Candidatus Omnitrophica bacterium]|nr:DUF3536 domain-containing protein [Candidatus Omnitrophota bacterium]